MSRKIGVGFNRMRVARRDIWVEWALARRMARLAIRNRRFRWSTQLYGASAVEARQTIIRDINGTI
jgi:hypothetical protein